MIIMNTTNKLEIAQLLREKTLMTVKDFSKKCNVSRKAFYESLEGNGSQRIRIEIARAVGKAPSLLWTELDERKKIIDDLCFARSFV